MKVTFLGTGTSQGIPIIGSTHPVCLSKNHKDKRLRASIVVAWDMHTYVIDCGPDFRQQMLRTNYTKIDGVLFTHEHADHTAGLDDLRPFYYKQGAINFYAHRRVINELKKRFDYIFNSSHSGLLSVIPNIIENKPFTLKNSTVIPINGLHYKLQVFGYRFNNFAYVTDMKTIADEELNKLRNLDTLVINALREEEHISHFTLNEALTIIAKLKPKRAYLTHISHYLGFHDEVEKKLPENVFLAYDNLTITIPNT